ncbi:MAG: LytTR family DNA-binding domain-containing protein [Oscillospiraceae bacterium]
MKVEFSIDPQQKEPKIIIVASEITEDLHTLANRLEHPYPDTVNGYPEHGLIVLQTNDILRIYAEQQKVYAQTIGGVFPLHARLYELEAQLDPQQFVRISNSEIVNSRKILQLDAKLSGTIRIALEGDIATFSSRRYASKIKRHFGL